VQLKLFLVKHIYDIAEILNPRPTPQPKDSLDIVIQSKNGKQYLYGVRLGYEFVQLISTQYQMNVFIFIMADFVKDTQMKVQARPQKYL